MVLTAAHCVLDNEGKESYVEIKMYFGTHVDMLWGCAFCVKLNYAKAKAYSKKVVIHPDYHENDNRGLYDIKTP